MILRPLMAWCQVATATLVYLWDFMIRLLSGLFRNRDFWLLSLVMYMIVWLALILL